MPQLAPVNWLFLFFIFWFAMMLISILVWWFFKPTYTIEKSSEILDPEMKFWHWS